MAYDHLSYEPPPCAGEGHDHPSHDWRTACLNCGVFRGSDLYATPRPYTAEGVSEAPRPNKKLAPLIREQAEAYREVGEHPNIGVYLLTLLDWFDTHPRLSRPVDKGEGTAK